MRRNKKPVTVLMPQELRDALTKFAQDSGRTRSAYIRQILRRYIRYMETRDDPDAGEMDWEI